MADKSDADKAKAEKLAEAKKKYEQLKKQKKGKGGKAGAAAEAKSGGGKKKKDDAAKAAAEKEDRPDVDDAEAKEDEKPEEEAEADPADADDDDNAEEQKKADANNEDKAEEEDKSKASAAEEATEAIDEGTVESKTPPKRDRPPSLSAQSRMRSTSFRRTSVSHQNAGGPVSPGLANGSKSPELPPLTADGDSINTIYRKQTARLDELEKENKRLSKESEDRAKKLQKTEAELDELREGSSEVAELKTRVKKLDLVMEELDKLKQDNESLQRQNTQLQSQSSKRHHSSSTSSSTSPNSSLQAQLDSKSSTIESMELEISNLRADLEKSITQDTSRSEQVTALEERLAKSESATATAQQELADAKKSLERASEKAVREGTEKTSSETKIRSLTREAEESKKLADEHAQRVETMKKKLTALTNIHKEADVRRQTHERERDKLSAEATDMRRRLAELENETSRLREGKERARKFAVSATGTNEFGDDGLDELEDAGRQKLESRIRELEGEVYSLRSGAWRDRRQQMQGGPHDSSSSASLSHNNNNNPAGPGSPGFDDIDLNGSPYTNAPRRKSTNQGGRQTSSFADVLNSGISAFTGGAPSPSHNDHSHTSPLLDDEDFDEAAFRQAQFDAQREEAIKRVERVKDIKRGLKDWKGWRMDLVELRRVGSPMGAGEIFEV